MEIHGIHGTQPVNAPQPVESAPASEATDQVQAADQLEISQEAEMASQAADLVEHAKPCRIPPAETRISLLRLGSISSCWGEHK